MTGTLLNAAAIVGDGVVGALLGDRLPLRVRSGVTDVLGSLILGGVIGELVDLERGLTNVGERLRDLVMRGGEELFEPEPSGPDRDVLDDPHPPHDPRHRFVEGFEVASLVAVVSPHHPADSGRPSS